MPKTSIIVLDIHQVVDTERTRVYSKDRHPRSHNNSNTNKDGDVSFLSLDGDEEQEERTLGTKSSTSRHDCSYSSSVDGNPRHDDSKQRRDSCTLSDCENGVQNDDTDEMILEERMEDESLFSHSQNSSAVFSFSDNEICQDSVSSMGDISYDSGNGTSPKENSRKQHDAKDNKNAKEEEQSVKDTFRFSFFGLLDVLQRGASNVYSAFWTFVTRKSWTMFAIMFEG